MKMEMRAFVRLALAAMACAMLLALPNAAQAWTFKVIHNFCSKFACADGADPQAGLLMDSSGNLYGTTEAGPNGTESGVAYELSLNAAKSKWVSTTLHKFCPACTSEGSEPRGELIIDTAGNLYGTTNAGGPDGVGTVFELQRDAQHRRPVFQILYSFTQFDPAGFFPLGALSYAGAASGAPYDGVSPLYGVTEEGPGSEFQQSAVFSLTPASGWTESVLYSFCSLDNCQDGDFPLAGVLVGASGSVFGTTADGGQQTIGGTVFQLTESGGSWTETLLHSFCATGRHCKDGAAPWAPLAMDASGALIGTTEGGGEHKKGCCGVVFKLVPNGTDSQYAVLHSFCDARDCKDGANPMSGVLIDATGNLYGATNRGGAHNTDTNNFGGGTVYKLTGSTLETLHAFCSQRDCADGEYPIGNLAMDSAGNIFGVTQGGGKFRRGVVYEISP